MKLYTQFHYEKTWAPTSDKDALRLLAEQFPEIPPETMLDYVKQECAQGKIVRFSDLKFKAEV